MMGSSSVFEGQRAHDRERGGVASARGGQRVMTFVQVARGTLLLSLASLAGILTLRLLLVTLAGN